MMATARVQSRCPYCELLQYGVGSFGACRRCGKQLRSGRVESTSVIVMPVPSDEVLTMRQIMQCAAVQAHRRCGGIMRAARALEISPEYFKVLLRESGDETDYRTNRKTRRECRG